MLSAVVLTLSLRPVHSFVICNPGIRAIPSTQRSTHHALQAGLAFPTILSSLASEAVVTSHRESLRWMCDQTYHRELLRMLLSLDETPLRHTRLCTPWRGRQRMSMI